MWGPGFAANPLDLLNPNKDPTDPAFQRAGAWMARVEVPLESLALTVVYAPQVTAQSSGLLVCVTLQTPVARPDPRN